LKRFSGIRLAINRTKQTEDFGRHFKRTKICTNQKTPCIKLYRTSQLHYMDNISQKSIFLQHL